jgi:hypothetical protein
VDERLDERGDPARELTARPGPRDRKRANFADLGGLPMTTATPIPNVPLPAGGTAVGQWNLAFGNARHFQGRIKRSVLTTYGRLGTLTTVEARAIAADLLAAVDDLDRSHDFFSF